MHCLQCVKDVLVGRHNCVYVERNQDGSLPLTANSRKFCAIRLTEVLHAMKHHYTHELSDFNAKLLMQQTPNTSMTIFKDCAAKFYDGPLPCTKSLTTTHSEDARETQTIVRQFDDLQPNELKKHRAVLFPASYLDICLHEPTLGDYTAVHVDAARKHGWTQVNLYEELVGGLWRGYRVLPGFEAVDIEIQNDDDGNDDTTNFVNSAINAMESEVRRHCDGDWNLDDLQEYMEGDEDELYGNPLPSNDDGNPPSPYDDENSWMHNADEENQDPQHNNPFNEGNQNQQRPFCYACQAGMANQMAHVGGCIPESAMP